MASLRRRMTASEGFTRTLVAAAEARQRAAVASEVSRQSEVHAAIVAADAPHARRLEEAEDKYRRAVAMAVVTFEEV